MAGVLLIDDDSDLLDVVTCSWEIELNGPGKKRPGAFSARPRWRTVVKKTALAALALPIFLITWDEKSCVTGLAGRLGLHAHDLEGGEQTFASDEPSARIDWILISDELRFESYETLKDQVSDHRGVVAEIALESL